MGYLLVIGMNVHVLTVSDSFKQDVPRSFFFILAGIVLFSVAARVLKKTANSLKFMEIQKITPLTDSVISLQIAAPPTFSYAPGQFAFVRFSGPSVSAEPHPFTIASSPGNHTLQFMIKKCGDWTSELELDSETSARVSLEGPYGLFSYKAKTPASHIVFIAGGIGITPMISMLRHIAAEKRQPRLLLLWSLRLKNEAFLQDELESLKKEIASLDVRLLFTREKSGERINKKLLEHLLHSFPDSSHFYICGPEQMMVKTRGILHDLGFQDKKIYWERFSL
jgi:predicted ferric reductase